MFATGYLRVRGGVLLWQPRFGQYKTRDLNSLRGLGGFDLLLLDLYNYGRITYV